tara:strand:+ start:135 stop:737 length:603 start_codon:yes stop_codon:yes gene_type:complete
MIFSNKLLLHIPLFFISSCTVMYPLTSEIVQSVNKKNININLYASPSSDSKSIINSDNKYMLVKGNELVNSSKWISTRGSSVIVTSNGRLIKTTGLEYNFSLRNNFIFKNIISSLNPYHYVTSDILFDNPSSGYLELNSRYSLANNDVKCECIVLKEDFIVKSISWSGINYYWIDNDYKVIKTLQHIHPFSRPYELEYFD